MIIQSSVTVPGMDGLLALIIAMLAFAAVIFIASRSARPLMFIGAALAVLAVALFLGVIG